MTSDVAGVPTRPATRPATRPGTARVDGVTLTAVDPTDVAQVSAVNVVRTACVLADSPWEHPWEDEYLGLFLQHGWDGEPPQFLAAHVDGELVGWAEYSTSEWDNLTLAWLGVGVAPEHRRRGIGSAVLAHILDRARSEGKTSVGIDAWDSTAGVREFAEKHGFRHASQAINRRQYLTDVPAGTLADLFAAARARAGDYELLKIMAPTPADLLPAIAELTASINDAPLDDLEIEDEVFPPERVARYEQAQLASRQRLYRLVARHRETGELAGHTVVACDSFFPQQGHQHDTAVAREHRGHRLGLLLKAGMVQWLAEVEPQLQMVDTWNAESNDFMISVNEALGYRVMGRGLQFQRAL